ncbi:hypothetical protein Tco_1128524, partial [Tanacetum coccineum]
MFVTRIKGCNENKGFCKENEDFVCMEMYVIGKDFPCLVWSCSNLVLQLVGPLVLATNPILDELLKEFRDELLDTTVVDEEADCNPIRDIEELERLLAKDPQSSFTEIKALHVGKDNRRL